MLMFRELMNFSYRRTPLQALGWYLIFLLIGLVIGFVIGFLAGIVTGSRSFTEGITAGGRAGQIAVIPYHIVLGIIPYHIVLGILLLWNRQKGAANISLALAGVVSSMLLGALGGLIPLAVLTTRPIASRSWLAIKIDREASVVPPQADTISAMDQGTKSDGAMTTVSVLSEDNDTTQHAFRDEAQRSDWELAAAYYPDLDAIYADLRRISPKLACAFRTTLVETKQFSRAKELAQQLEENFLQTYFGRNPKILAFARALAARGHKAAAKELNRSISVLGGGADKNLIIERIRKKFDLVPDYAQSALKLAEALSQTGRVDRSAYANASSLIKELGGTVTVRSGVFADDIVVEMIPTLGERRYFSLKSQMTAWVMDTIVPHVLSSVAPDRQVHVQGGLRAEDDQAEEVERHTTTSSPHKEEAHEPGNDDYVEARADTTSKIDQRTESNKPQRSTKRTPYVQGASVAGARANIISAEGQGT